MIDHDLKSRNGEGRRFLTYDPRTSSSAINSYLLVERFLVGSEAMLSVA